MTRIFCRNQQYQNQSRCGATTVEVAITFPVLMILVMLVFEVSRMMMVQQCLGFAAQTGCRHASLATSLSTTEVETVTQNSLLTAIPNAASSVSVSVSPGMAMGMAAGTPMTVTAQVRLSDVSWLSGNLLGFLGDPLLSSSAVQNRE